MGASDLVDSITSRSRVRQQTSEVTPRRSLQDVSRPRSQAKRSNTDKFRCAYMPQVARRETQESELAESVASYRRRNLRPLTVQTNFALPDCSEQRTDQASWTRCDPSIKTLYALKGHVASPCLLGMERRYATRKGDGHPSELKDIIMEVRKVSSFVSPAQAEAWCHCAELLMELPRCPGLPQVCELLKDSSAFYIVLGESDSTDGVFQTCVPTEDVKKMLRQLLENLSTWSSFPMPVSNRPQRQLASPQVSRPQSPEGMGVIESLSSTPRSASGSQQSPRGSSPLSSRGSSKRSTVGASLQIQRSLAPRASVSSKDPSSNLSSPRSSIDPGTDQTPDQIALRIFAGRTPTSDVFSVGVIAYTLLTGISPFRQTPEDPIMQNPAKFCTEDEKQAWRTFMDSHVKCLSWDHDVFVEDPDAKVFLAKLMSCNEGERPSAEGALRDRWLAI